MSLAGHGHKEKRSISAPQAQAAPWTYAAELPALRDASIPCIPFRSHGSPRPLCWSVPCKIISIEYNILHQCTSEVKSPDFAASPVQPGQITSVSSTANANNNSDHSALNMPAITIAITIKLW